MGWNKRSSGHKYDSISGHGFLMGGLNKKVLNHRSLSKCCTICSKAQKQGVPAKGHECPKNHDGSSKSMETEAIYQMVLEATRDQGFTVATIISDDDSTMKSNLKWSYKELVNANKMKIEDWPKTKKGNKKQDNGRLPLDCQEPKFLADFNHRVKTVGKRFYELASAPKKTSLVDTSLARRMKLNWATMMKQVRHLKYEEDEKEIKSKMLAPIEHVFGNHEHCGSWCYFKKAEKEGKKYLPADNLPIYSKTEDSKTYKQMNNAIEVFKEEENIKETLHNYDTQQNEALNMAISRYVPKFKHFGTTMALDTRIRCVIAQHNMTYRGFYLTLLANLGCLDDTGLALRPISIGISRINDARVANKIYKQQPKNKRRRKHGLLAKTKQQIFEERVDRAAKMGTYRTGIAVEEQEQQEQQKTRQSSTNSNKVCARCGKKGHLTTRSAKCLFHQEWIEGKNKKASKPIDTDKQTNDIELTNKNKKIPANNIFVGENEKLKKSDNMELMDLNLNSTGVLDAPTCVPPSIPGTVHIPVLEQISHVPPVQPCTENVETLPNRTLVQSQVQPCTKIVDMIPNRTLVQDHIKSVSTIQKQLPKSTTVLNVMFQNKSTGVDSTEASQKRNLDSHSKNISDVEGSVEDFFDRDEEADMYSENYSEDSNESEN